MFTYSNKSYPFRDAIVPSDYRVAIKAVVHVEEMPLGGHDHI